MPPSTKPTTSTSPLRERYLTLVVPKLREQLKRTNVHALPRVTKVVLNVGLGRAQGDAKALEAASATLRRITGQEPVQTRARKSISSFKLRQGSVIGVTVTLRGRRMEDFLWKLVNVTLPRIRDFQGLSPKSFGSSGTYTIGFKENLSFPEIKSDGVDRLHGLEVTIVTSATTSDAGLALLKALGFPFQS